MRDFLSDDVAVANREAGRCQACGLSQPASDKPPALLHSVREAARLLGIGQSTCWAMIARGQLKTIAIGRSRRIPHTELKRIAGGGS